MNDPVRMRNLGRLGGSAVTEPKRAASRRNGSLGGRPRKQRLEVWDYPGTTVIWCNVCGRHREYVRQGTVVKRRLGFGTTRVRCLECGATQKRAQAGIALRLK